MERDDELEILIGQDEEIEMALDDSNVVMEQNENNTMDINEENESETKVTESNNFIDAENNEEKGSILEDGIRQSVRIKDGVSRPSRFNNAGIKGK